MSYYKDLREYLRALEASGKLVRIKRPMNKDTQIHPLVRLQFRGLAEEQRKGFLFENVVDGKGRKYSSPLAVCVLAPSREVYALGMMCKPEEIRQRWVEAQRHPIAPRMVADGPVHEEIHAGDTLLQHGGLGEFPIPISTPGYDVAPFSTAGYWVTKDPDTQVRNVATHRAHVKSPTRTGIMLSSLGQHIGVHFSKCREREIPLEAAIVVGTSPNVGYVSVTRLPYEVDEFAYAGGLAREPVDLVKCKTVDLEVPANAEVVIEGTFSTTELEPEAPFGEGYGYMGVSGLMPYFTVKCITHRKNPIWQSFVSQFPPNESSKIRQIAREGVMYEFIKSKLNIPQVIDVVAPESCASTGFFVIRFKGASQDDVWRALEAVSAQEGNSKRFGKIFIAVDEDVNSQDPAMVNWALFTRVQPHRDMRVKKYPSGPVLDYSICDPSEISRQPMGFALEKECSHVLINATLKWPYPCISLPKKEYMDDALRIWKEEHLPTLELKEPWWGYSLGLWTAEDEEFAALAVKGEHYKVGEILAKRRRKLA